MLRRFTLVTIGAALALTTVPATAAEDGRTFPIDGDRVSGGDSSADALELSPGLYRDTVRGAGTSRYYVIDKPEGGGVAVSATVRPADGSALRGLGIDLLTPGGDSCASAESRASAGTRLRPVISVGAHYVPSMVNPDSPCATADRIVAQLQDTGAAGEIEVELSVSTIPAVTNADDLPPAIDDPQPWLRAAQSGGDVSSVSGGHGFDDAPTLEPGRYRDEIRSGEILLYRVEAGWGQAPRVTFTVETDAEAAGVLSLPGARVRATMTNPLRQTLGAVTGNDASAESSYTAREPAAVTAASPQIRYLNSTSTSSGIRQASMAGAHYVMLELSELSRPPRVTVPVTIAVEVDGEVTGEPDFAGSIEGPGGSSGFSFPGTLLAWVFGCVGLILLLAAGIIAAILLRRRSPDTPPYAGPAPYPGPAPHAGPPPQAGPPPSDRGQQR